MQLFPEKVCLLSNYSEGALFDFFQIPTTASCGSAVAVNAHLRVLWRTERGMAMGSLREKCVRSEQNK